MRLNRRVLASMTTVIPPDLSGSPGGVLGERFEEEGKVQIEKK